MPEDGKDQRKIGIRFRGGENIPEMSGINSQSTLSLSSYPADEYEDTSRNSKYLRTSGVLTLQNSDASEKYIQKINYYVVLMHIALGKLLELRTACNTVTSLLNTGLYTKTCFNKYSSPLAAAYPTFGGVYLTVQLI